VGVFAHEEKGKIESTTKNKNDFFIKLSCDESLGL
jgi:hypothetical protein